MSLSSSKARLLRFVHERSYFVSNVPGVLIHLLLIFALISFTIHLFIPIWGLLKLKPDCFECRQPRCFPLQADGKLAPAFHYFLLLQGKADSSLGRDEKCGEPAETE
jgi:hypothetical protein